MRVLGFETSCDDTAVAVVDDGCHVRSSVVSTQEEHVEFGGVVPEIAARKHVEALPAMLELALERADASLESVDGIAVTRGPGLIGALLTGWCYARALARARDLPYVAVHHLAAHVHGALMPVLADRGDIRYPLVALVVSGGHTALYEMDGPERHRLLGKTRDDAAGEALDKVAKLLELGFPGGPVIERLAAEGDPSAFELPRPDLGLDFSFSGLKTAARRAAIAAELPLGAPHDARVRDFVAAFQGAVVDVLGRATAAAVRGRRPAGLVLAGGVAANRMLRDRCAEIARERGIDFHVSPPRLSTDNAAMVAGAAAARLARGDGDPLELAARAAWPLDGAESVQDAAG